MFRTSVPALTMGLSFAFHFSDAVALGKRSRRQVSIVLTPVTTRPAPPLAQPVGVMVKPTQSSSIPQPGHHESSSSGTVSHTVTSHQVLEFDLFLMKIS